MRNKGKSIAGDLNGTNGVTRKEEILTRINEREALYKTKADENAVVHEVVAIWKNERKLLQ